MTINVEWVGFDRMVRFFAIAGDRALPAVGQALHEEALSIFRESQAQVPFDQGVLSASGQVHPAAISGSEVVVEITYGGNAIDYAAVQHENLSFQHDPGRKSHYLQDPFEDHVDRVDWNIATRVEAILRGLI